VGHLAFRPGRCNGRHHFGGVLEAVGLVQDVEQLGICVLVLLARVRVGRVHIVGDGVGDDPALCSVLGPRRDGVAQVLADHASKEGTSPGWVEAAEQVVERAVLEQDQDHVVHGIRTFGSHGDSF